MLHQKKSHVTLVVRHVWQTQETPSSKRCHEPMISADFDEVRGKTKKLCMRDAFLFVRILSKPKTRLERLKNQTLQRAFPRTSKAAESVLL